MKQYFDILGNELFNGDEVVTIRKNGRAVGGDLVKAFIIIDDKGIRFDKDKFGTYYYELYKNNIQEKCAKVIR